MPEEEATPIVTYITWKPGFDSIVGIINCQHKGIMRFINEWYSDVYYKRISNLNIFDYMKDKYQFLQTFSDSHFVFEDALLTILTEKLGFPEKVYTAHLNAHSKFINNFMNPLFMQIEMFDAACHDADVRELTIDALKDVAHWWYNHIKDSCAGKTVSYDHYYRLYIESLCEKDKILLFNELLMFVESCPQKFSCTTW
ncbi:MAG: hypothetical protein ACOZEN_15065 [Thermodesulfobacteriota bacterium]